MATDNDYSSEYERIYSISKKRRATPCYFKDGLSQDDFENIARRVAKKKRYIKNLDSEKFISSSSCPFP